jgi:mono/diheme cytochrome c family protein
MWCKRIFPSFVASLLLLLLSTSRSSQAQQGTPSHTPPVRVDYDMRVLLASRSGPEAQGRKLFAQRCALCHIGASTEQPYGGWLDRQRIQTISEGVARQLIMDGTPRMPGWKYTLEPGQVEKVIAYLRTVTTSKKIDPMPDRKAVIER